MTLKKILIVIAGGCFLLATFGVSFIGLSLGWLGLAFYMASELVT